MATRAHFSPLGRQLLRARAPRAANYHPLRHSACTNEPSHNAQTKRHVSGLHFALVPGDIAAYIFLPRSVAATNLTDRSAPPLINNTSRASCVRLATAVWPVWPACRFTFSSFATFARTCPSPRVAGPGFDARSRRLPLLETRAHFRRRQVQCPFAFLLDRSRQPSGQRTTTLAPR